MTRSNNPYFWQETDIETLKSTYTLGGLQAACAALPHKTRGTIATKASRIELTNPRPRKKNLFERNEQNDD